MKSVLAEVNGEVRGVRFDKTTVSLEDCVAALDISFDMSNLHEEPTKEYPGLVNMGMTCYMNSYLQTLFHIKMFVREIMQVAPSHQADAEPADEGPINGLKCLFYDMLTSKGHIQTANLTRSFGWESRDVFTQQDVQEFSCILLDVIEKKVEAPNKPNFIKELFCGKLINYIKCTRVNFISEREETFYDIQLPVKGFKNIYESLRDYTLEEVLAGENKYDTETYGKQEAKKGIKFRSLPKLLFFHLRRFEYDIQQDQNVKVGRGDQILQNYQFDDEIDFGIVDDGRPVGGEDAARN